MVLAVGQCSDWKEAPREEHPGIGQVTQYATRAWAMANILLGGSADSQKEFLEALSTEDLRRTGERHGSKQPPIANSFALGYTYHDVLDADHEGET